MLIIIFYPNCTIKYFSIQTTLFAFVRTMITSTCYLHRFMSIQETRQCCRQQVLDLSVASTIGQVGVGADIKVLCKTEIIWWPD